MCQICIVNLGDKLLNQMYLLPLLQLDSMSNGDGTGFLAVDDDGKSNLLYKTKMAAHSIEELGLDIRENITSNRLVLAHVRAASKGIVVKDENAHPFRGDRFSLVHNGRLYKKDEDVVWNSTNDDTSLNSDSEEFLKELESYVAKHKKEDFLTCLRAVMAMHKGKFALGIYDSDTDQHYVARGSTADLHIAHILEAPDSGGELESIGFIINTKKQQLDDAITIITQAAQAVSGRRLIPSKIEELKKDTVYQVKGKDLVELGEMKEISVSYTYPKANTATGWKASSGADLKLVIWKNADRLARFMKEHFLGIYDMDALFYLTLGAGLADITEEDIDIFIEQVIPRVSAPKKVKERIGKLLDRNGQIYPIMYQNVPELVYPWFLSEPAAINALVKQLEAKRVK